MVDVTLPEDAPVLRRAVFPVKVTLPDGGTVALAKLFVTERRVYVYGNGAAQTPELLWSEPYTAAELPPTFAPRSDLYRIVTAAGELVATRLPGCGCHVRALKNLQPFTPTRLSG